MINQVAANQNKRINNTISISSDTGECTESEFWRSFSVQSDGETLPELLESASIIEVDQDGEDIDHYPLADAPTRVQRAAERIIAREFLSHICGDYVATKRMENLILLAPDLLDAAMSLFEVMSLREMEEFPHKRELTDLSAVICAIIQKRVSPKL